MFSLLERARNLLPMFKNNKKTMRRRDRVGAAQDCRWSSRSSSGLQLPVKVQKVSECHISRWIFIAHRPGDSQAEEPHGSPEQLFWRVRLFWLAWLFWLARLFCQHPSTAVLCTKYTGLVALLSWQLELQEGRLAHSSD